MVLHDTILMGWNRNEELVYIRTFNQHHKKWKLDKAHKDASASYSRVAMYHMSYFSDVKVKEDDMCMEKGTTISFPGRSFYKSSLGEIFNFDHSVLNRLDTYEREKVLKSLAEMAAKELEKLNQEKTK